MDQAQTQQLLLFLGGANPRTRLPAEALDAWALILANENYGEIAAAAAEWCREHEQFPTPAELRRFAHDRRAHASLPALPESPPSEQETSKARMQFANWRRRFSGGIDTPTMMRESARIYAEERPFAATAQAIAEQDATEAAIAGLRGTAGPLAPTLRRALRHTTARGGDAW